MALACWKVCGSSGAVGPSSALVMDTVLAAGGVSEALVMDIVLTTGLWPPAVRNTLGTPGFGPTLGLGTGFSVVLRLGLGFGVSLGLGAAGFGAVLVTRTGFGVNSIPGDGMGVNLGMGAAFGAVLGVSGVEGGGGGAPEAEPFLGWGVCGFFMDIVFLTGTPPAGALVMETVCCIVGWVDGETSFGGLGDTARIVSFFTSFLIGILSFGLWALIIFSLIFSSWASSMTVVVFLTYFLLSTTRLFLIPLLSSSSSL